MQGRHAPAGAGHVDRIIARLAATQRGLVTTGQLRVAGITGSAISRRVRSGRLHRVHRGVFLVGHCVAPELAGELAALLACGGGSALSRRTAARLWNAADFQTRESLIEVAVPGRNPEPKAGIATYGVRTLDERDVREVAGLRVTSPARTLLDLAPLLPFHALEQLYADLHARRLVDSRELHALLARRRGCRGAHALRRLIVVAEGRGPTRSASERKAGRVITAAGLPAPLRNAPVGPFRVDFLWRAERVILEIDGYAFRSGRRAFERDRQRDAALAALGYITLRVTWTELEHRPLGFVARLAQTLARRHDPGAAPAAAPAAAPPGQ